MMVVSKELNIPVIEGISTAEDMPYTIAHGLLYRTRINSFQELPQDKRPPRDLWDKPYKLEEFFDEVFDRKDIKKTEFITIDEDEIE